jgi:hypothetical protein
MLRVLYIYAVHVENHHVTCPKWIFSCYESLRTMFRRGKCVLKEPWCVATIRCFALRVKKSKYCRGQLWFVCLKSIHWIGGYETISVHGVQPQISHFHFACSLSCSTKTKGAKVTPPMIFSSYLSFDSCLTMVYIGPYRGIINITSMLIL